LEAVEIEAKNLVSIPNQWGLSPFTILLFRINALPWSDLDAALVE
jgi:hypothetical protein